MQALSEGPRSDILKRAIAVGSWNSELGTHIRGCLEAYCSGPSIARRAREALAHAPESALNRLGRPPCAEDVVACAKQGDALAVRLWSETLDLLAAGIVSVLNALEPSIVVLGGGVTRAGADLFDPLAARVDRAVMFRHCEHARIVPSKLGENVGILGAAAVALWRQGTADEQ